VIKILGRFVRDRCGATSIEYGLIAAFIFMAIIAAVRQVGVNLVPWFQAVADGLN
jgi:pilus assembly protein Flp/PilA